MTARAGIPDTFPKLLREHARLRGESPAIREKNLGIWQAWTWREVEQEARALACGLSAAGLRPGRHLAVIGANRPRLYCALAAAQSLGAIPVPFYEDAPAQEMIYVFQNAEIEFAIVEDQEQVDKLLEILPDCPHLKRIYYDDPRGLRHYAQPELASYESLRDAGRAWDAAHAGFFDESVAGTKPGDTAIMMYTSGTTGHAKGVVLSHENLIESSRAYSELEHLTDREEGPRVPAHGVDRAERLFVRPVDVRRIPHQLPRIRRHGDHRHARDRPDVLLRAAARARGAPHAGHDPHGRRVVAQAAPVPLLHGPRPPRRRAHPRREARVRRRSHPLCRSAAWSCTGRCAIRSA
jgi:acyl-CoA synthetase (AMP-forming)/AMP-acid ligase II